MALFQVRIAPMLSKKDQQSEERRERLALGHKNWEKQWKTVKNMVKTTHFFEQIARFL